MQDKQIECVGPRRGQSCPNQVTFTFTEGEQRYYQERGYQDPKRCKECCAIKKHGNARLELEKAQGEARSENHGGRRVKREYLDILETDDKEMFGE